MSHGKLDQDYRNNLLIEAAGMKDSRSTLVREHGVMFPIPERTILVAST